jgi:hypothetical protein
MELSGYIQAPVALPRDSAPVATGSSAVWTREPVRTLWRTEKFIVSTGNQTSVAQLVTNH